MLTTVLVPWYNQWMKVQILSDAHVEFHRDGGAAFWQSIPVVADVLVLAGDIDQAGRISETLRACAARWPHVVYVLGNHSFYGREPAFVEDTLSTIVSKVGNLHWLNNSDVWIDGYRFLGGTLWFPESPDAWLLRGHLNDFACIKAPPGWFFKQYEATRAYLNRELNGLRSPDARQTIVVTHHLPSGRSVASRFKRSRLNCYFVGPADEAVDSGNAALWIHGHTHDSADWRSASGATRVVCNPFGYPTEINPDFKEDFVVTV